MTKNQPLMKMPDLLVFARSFFTGLFGMEVLRVAMFLGENFSATLSNIALWAKIAGISATLVLCLIYAVSRGAHFTFAKIVSSFRVDLLVAIGIGIWINILLSPLLTRVHLAIKSADPNWAPAILLMGNVMLLSPLIQNFLVRPKKRISQLYFMSDEEIDNEKEDLYANEAQARSFADTVLASGDHQGLVFGIDGPWGVGKTSFVNMAEHYWANAEDKAIVCRFEPLRYASEPDLTDRLIRDLSAAIQQKVFAPEFRSAASRYSKLIKGKADISFLGFKISLEPSLETVDELLDNIDEVLRRIGRRVIIVIDDLDRLDAKTTNNVLFATKQTFKLSQATYVLCYDTEVLAINKDEGARAREFLEKFVTVKLSLFVDSSNIRDFLRRDWQRAESRMGSIPSDTMFKLGGVLNELADILDSELAANYLPLVGDLRKVKRFVNAMVLMQIEKSDLGRTDFNKRDLINLMLLHLNFPGLFRRIYAQETEGRQGSFSVRREYGKREFKNADELSKLMDEFQGTSGFLLSQLFDVTSLQLADTTDIDEAILASRACFNHHSFRNLENYLKLIVRFTSPEPQKTFILYQEAVKRVRNGAPIQSILNSPDFRIEQNEHAHDQFWRVLVNQSYDFTRDVADHAINCLVEYLPRYSVIRRDDQGLRQRSIYSLLRLLDRAGWGRTSGRRLPNTSENLPEIAWRIFGQGTYENKGLLERISESNRGVLGWNDLMLFRLQCSADRQGQLHNVHSALIIHQDQNAPTNGLVSSLALVGMRLLSQEVFALFKRTYIEPKRNFIAEVSNARAEDFLGAASAQFPQQTSSINQSKQDAAFLDKSISSARSSIASFVIYQLSNKFLPKGSGVGCGHYDERGDSDSGGISRVMNEYMFRVCFNPDFHNDNVFHFLDYCLSNLSNPFFSDLDEVGFYPSKEHLPGGLDSKQMGQYWKQHRQLIRDQVLITPDRHIVTSNYTASYSEDLNAVFIMLDEFAEEATPVEADSNKSLSPAS